MVFLRTVKQTNMAKKHDTHHDDTGMESVEASLNKAEQYIENNLNTVLGVLGGIVVIILGFWGYNKYISEPYEMEAQEMIYPAQRNFERDSLRLALNGNGQDMGFIEVADEYSGTKAGNLANYYAGVCYLNLGNYAEAIAYLEDFSSEDGVLNVLATGAIGDAFHELNQPEEALEYYAKAAKLEGNEFVTPMMIKKAGLTAEMIEDWSAAIDQYERLQAEYPLSNEAQDIEKNIAYCEAKAGN